MHKGNGNAILRIVLGSVGVIGTTVELTKKQDTLSAQKLLLCLFSIGIGLQEIARNQRQRGVDRSGIIW